MDLNSSQINEKLYFLLKHACETTAYYANLLPNWKDIDKENIETVFGNIPFLTRHDIQLHRNRLISTQGDSRDWCVMRTSGTTNEPLDFIRDAEFQIIEAKILAEHFDRCLTNINWRSKNLIHASLNSNLQTRSIPSVWDSVNSKLIKWNLTRIWHTTNEEFIRCLESFNSNIITMFPSVAKLIAKRIRDTNSIGRINPCLILLSGEMVDKSLRYLLQDIFSCAVTNIYTMTEIPIIGSECLTDGGFHIENQSVVLEIINNKGISLNQKNNAEGDVVVTALENRAMPLIRYRTGDRACWITTMCHCGRLSPRIEIRNARQFTALLNAQNKNIDKINFAKLLRDLDIDQYSFEQAEDRSITLFYKASKVLSLSSLNHLLASLNLALGFATKINIHRVTSIESIKKLHKVSNNFDKLQIGFDIESINVWLKKELATYDWIDTALLTGSALTFNATTKFSDIDLSMITSDSAYLLPWLQLTARLKRSIPNLNCMCNERKDFELHFPLLTCRLIKEQIIVKGKFDLKWPDIENIRIEAKHWLCNTATLIAHRLANTDFTSQNPIQEAWIAMKYTANALRYYYLLNGVQETAAQKIEALFAVDTTYSECLRKDIIKLFQIAREQIPPPSQSSGNASFFHLSALYCIKQVIRNVT